MKWVDIKYYLSAPFPVDQVHWRIGARNRDKTKGIALAYVDARDVMRRLDDVCGANWQARYPLSDNGLLICEIGLKIDDEWIWRGNGAGDTQVEAEKGKASDAFKRAGVLWGVARYLYDLPNTWHDLKDDGRKFVTPPSLPAWATPQGEKPKKRNINRPKAQQYIKQIESMIEDEDGLGLRQLNDELKENEDMWRFVWDYFSTDQGTKAKGLIHSARDIK